MKQVAQVLGTGVIDVFEVPVPTLTDEFVLVRNHASLISAGTEKTKVDMGKKSLLQKARARPDQVAQVLKKIQTDGLLRTIRTVQARLDSLSAMGYSCAGTVAAVGGNVTGLRPGDRVACGGAGYANHAEFVAVPKNLVVRIPDELGFDEASFTTVGAIALQGLRLTEPLLGETFLVIGLGLLGQITVQLLRANGCRVIATDLDPDLVKRAESFGAIGVGGVDVANSCRYHTGGHGVDGVLVCAGSSSNSIIELSGEVTREKGRVVVVGAVRMDIPREPFFKKEISVVISRSYGPGRYDPSYEEHGHDYPFGYVRFSEQRNMEAIVRLIADRKLDVRSLISHRFPVTDASKAYSLIEGQKSEPYIGIVLVYSEPKIESPGGRQVIGDAQPVEGAIRIGCYGAGNYATAMLLPQLSGVAGVALTGVVTSSGRTAQAVAKRFGFSFCAADYSELLAKETDVVLIASRHDSHAEATCRALDAGKHVYVEKPLALSVEELGRIRTSLQNHPELQLMVGFNRRFAPATGLVVEHFSGVSSPLVVNIRINAGHIPNDHWIQHPKLGGGRILGEACHFVDLAAALVRSEPKRVFATAVGDPGKTALNSDNVSISLDFANGAVANIVYVAGGSKGMRKEHVEVFGGGRAAVIDDFRGTVLFGVDGSARKVGSTAQDKGQSTMLSRWLEGLRTGRPCVETRTLLSVSLATVLAVESLCVGMPLTVTDAVFDTPAPSEQ